MVYFAQLEAMKPYVPVYRKLLARAWNAAWQHRGLWIFGFFAGLAQTGAVTNDILRLAPTLEPGTLSWATLQEQWSSFTFGKTMLEGLAAATPSQVTVTLITTGVSILLALLLILGSQHILLTSAHRASRNKTRISLRSMLRELRGIHLGRLFSIDILARLATLIILLGGSLMLRAILAQTPSIAGIVTFAMYLVVLPLAFAVSAVAMNALIHIVRESKSVGGALHAAIGFTTTHWLPTLEFAAILFLVNILYSFGLLIALVLLSQIMIALFAASITSATVLLMLFALSALAIVALVVGIFGWMTTLNYCAWTEFVERYVKFPAHPRSEHAAAWFHRAFIR